MPIIIRHNLTGERFSFPRHNVNQETYEDFTQYQVVPVGFSLDPDQTTPAPAYNADTATLRWEANSKDPVNTMNKWRKE